MKHLLSLLLVMLSVTMASGQVLSSLPENPDDFMKEFVSYMKSTKRDDNKESVEKFADQVKNGQISPDQLSQIITTSNIMLGSKLRANPHFDDYLGAIDAFVASGLTADRFKTWSIVMDSVIITEKTGRSKDFGKFIDFSVGLFSKNAMFDSKLKSWIMSGKDWQLTYSNQQPVLVMPEGDLTGISPKDTTAILATTGKYYPLLVHYNGDKGKVTWEKVGFDPNTVYAEFKSFVLPLDEADFAIDTVTFYHKDYFNFPLEGSLLNKLTTQRSDNYPKFTSFRSDLAIDDLGPNIKFIGGFSLAGSQIIGTGNEYGKAHLDIFQDNGKKAMTMLSNSIIIKKGDELFGQNAEITIFLGQDSIYHPGLSAKYRMDKKELSLYTGSDGISASAFYDSYHNMEIRAEAIIWNINETTMTIKMMSGAGLNPVTVSSEGYFRKGELEKYATALDFNPISVIKMYAESTRSREFYAESLAKKMNPNYTENTIRRILYKMVEEGFIYYNEASGVVTVKDKVFNYVFANADLRDYDIIIFESYATKENGKLDLESNIISLSGVKQITLSDSQDVRLFPGDIDIELHKDQDIKFSNVVIAGIIDFVGTGFYFDYDSFRIDLTDLAAATINVPTGEKDEDGDDIYAPLKSKIEGLTGYLDIDVPNNKSGKEDNPSYPIFTNREKSYVYYDQILDSTYIRDKFFFELDPFTFDSLITFDPYLSDLKGRLLSADIFPTFEEQLKIQEDLSLGFQRVTPEKGYDVYKGKGHYNDSIMLSNDGLRGKGHIDYLFTNFASNDILFTPDSLNAVADTFHMDSSNYNGYSYPLVDGTDNDIHWLPYTDSMFINMRSTPFAMYGDGSSLKGNLLLTAEGLKGDGSFEFNEAALVSTEFSFEKSALESDTMAMQIKSLDEDKVTFNTPNVSGRVDFGNRIGSFKSNELDIATEFSNNLYKTEINEFFWDMDANILDFKAPAGSEGSYFISTRGDQDSLKFLGTRAYFNMTTSIIDVTGVPYILVADAKIVPDSNKVVIQPGGLLDTLYNAVVYADTAHEAYKLYDAEIIIESKRTYKGNGTFDYVYEKAPAQPIRFNEIIIVEEEKRKGNLYKTTATTTVAAEDSFMLNDGYAFTGTLNLQAEERYLEFDGAAKLLKTSGKLDDSHRFLFKDRINPDTAVLHYTTVDEQGDTMAMGLYYDMYDTTGYYVALMSPMRDIENIATLPIKGITKYNSKTQTYYFGNEDRLLNGAPDGNTLSYNTADNTMHLEGPLNLNVNFDPIEHSAVGSVNYWVDSSKFVFKTMLGLNLPIDKTLIEQMVLDINSFSFDKPSADYTNNDFKAALGNLIGGKKAEKTIEELNTTGIFTRPKELKENIVFSDVELLYDPYYQIYRSVGPFTLSFVGETGVHKKLTGYVELGMRKNNDFFNIYIESSFDDYYYISYKNNTLQMVSSKEEFNKLLAAIEADKRKIKMDGDEFFFYTISTYSNMQSFLQRMKLIESGERIEIEVQTEEDDLEMELEMLRQELLDAEESGNDVEDVVAPPVYDPRQGMDNTPAPSEDSGNAPQPDQMDAPKPVLKEMQNFEEDGGKKGKKKKKGNEPESFDNTPNEPAPEPVEEPVLKEMQDFEEDGGKKGKKKKKDTVEEEVIDNIPTEEPTPAPVEPTPTPKVQKEEPKQVEPTPEPEVEEEKPRSIGPSSPSVEKEAPAPEEEPASVEEDTKDKGSKKKKKKGKKGDAEEEE